MKATIKVTGIALKREDLATEYKATFEERWTSENDHLAEVLNALCSIEQMEAAQPGYQPNPVMALAHWSVEYLRSKGYQAEFVSAEEIDDSQHPDDAEY